MKILQTIAGMAASGGGTSSCTAQLFTAMHALDPEVSLLTIAPAEPGTEMLGEGEPWLQSVAHDCRTPLAYSSSFRRALRQADASLMHTNGLWIDPNHATCAEARRRGIPYVITPHGMLYPEALARSRWKKRPMEWLWFRKDILSASAIHVTCEREMEHVRAYGYRGPIALIGNPITIPDYIPSVIAPENEANAKRTADDTPLRYIGFLGRLHPRKQVEQIFRGLALLPADDQGKFRIVIMGQGPEDYERFLNDEAQRLGIRHLIEFKGFINGRAKFEQLARLSALMVPSDIENFGMIIPEALLVNTPVMASTGTPWDILEQGHCGWWRPATPQSIAEVLREILATSPSDLRAMGRRGAAIIADRFAAPVIADRMLELYRHLLGLAPRADFIHLS